MIGFQYLKVAPTTHGILYKGGKIAKEGRGLAFWYFAPTSVVSLIPVGTVDVPFVFEEATADFQEATIQGELTYRITNPSKIASLLDFSVDGRQRYRSDDPAKLSERLIHATQMLARSFIQGRILRELLVGSDTLASHVVEGLKSAEAANIPGVEVMSVAVVSIKATPEMAKALQAEARELLLRNADAAIYERRNQAVELERRIKENELQTEKVVEERKREVGEARMAGEIALEEQRAALVDTRVANEKKEAEARGEALKATLTPLKDIDWRTLLAAGGGLDAKTMIALAFRDLADNAEKIGTLNVSPELLETLMRSPERRKSERRE